jgi:transposase
MTTPNEARLLQENEALRRENQRQAGEIERLIQENKLLRARIDLLIRKIFGASSEKLDPGQLELLLEGTEVKKPEASGAIDALEADNEKEAGKQPKARSERELIKDKLDTLPTEDIIIEPVEVMADPEAWRHVDDEITRQLDYVPPRYFCRRIIRRRYAKRDRPDLPPVVAALPTMLERSIAGPGLLASVLVGKYCDHLPLYRQEQIMRQRHDINLPRQTTCRWVEMAADWLRPVYQNIIGGVLGGGYVQVDETVIKYLDPGNGKARQGYFWTVKRPGGGVFYRWETTRSAACLERLLPGNWNGIIQCDGYAAYQAYVKGREADIGLAGCWAHVRRKFVDAKDQARLHAGLVLRQLQYLYRLEQEMRDKGLPAKLRQRERQWKAAPVIARIGRMLEVMKRRHLPASLMGRAISYTRALWPLLGTYLRDGRVEIDNNLVENAIRPTAVGKKNWLFIGQAEAGERSAIIYTIIGNCRQHGLDPQEYLRDVFTRMPMMSAKEYPSLDPARYAEAKRMAEARARLVSPKPIAADLVTA